MGPVIPRAPAQDGVESSALAVVCKKAQSALKDGRYCEAFKQLKEFSMEAECSYDQLVASCQQQGLADFSDLKGLVAWFAEGQAALQSEAGWTAASSGKLQAYYSQQKGPNAHSFKFKGVISTKIENVVSIVRECDLFSRSDSKSSGTILWQPNLFETAIVLQTAGSMGFQGWQYVLHAHGANLSQEDGSILIMLNDLCTDPLPPGCQEPPPVSSKFNRISLLQGSCLQLRPLQERDADGKVQTEMTLLVHMDPHYKYLPAWWLKLILRFGAPVLYKMMQTALQKLFAEGKDLPLRMAQQPNNQVYDLIRRYYDPLYNL
jgi:hypothetical protein